MIQYVFHLFCVVYFFTISKEPTSIVGYYFSYYFFIRLKSSNFSGCNKTTASEAVTSIRNDPNDSNRCTSLADRLARAAFVSTRALRYNMVTARVLYSIQFLFNRADNYQVACGLWF